MMNFLPLDRVPPCAEPADLAVQLEVERAARLAAEKVAEKAWDELRRVQQSEVCYRQLTEHAIDLITVLEADGTIRFESISVTRSLGWTPDQYRGRSAFDFVHPEDLPRVIESFKKCLSDPQNAEPVSFRFRHKDGGYRILEGVGHNLLEDAAVCGIVFNSRDVTEKRRLETLFEQFTGGVAHDFNNLLTAILGYSDVAQRQLDNPAAVANALKEIKETSERAAGIASQLLGFSRKQVLQPQTLALEKTIRDQESVMHHILGDEIELVVQFGSPLAPVKMDPRIFEQVLFILLSNARDAMPEGGTVLIELRPCSGADAQVNDFLELVISDTGRGIAPETLPRIFDPFFSTKSFNLGSGLGLAACQGFIKQSGGEITVESAVGVGTTFRILLPRASELLQKATSAMLPKMPEKSGQRCVLLAEDEAILRELATMQLEELGYRVVSVENGAEALALLEAQPQLHPDLLFTDVMMPQMGGRDLSKHIRELIPGIPVIYCSGYNEDSLLLGGQLDPGEYFLPKPYAYAALTQMLERVLGPIPTSVAA